ncbi:MAG: ATP-binding protein [Gemmatimonadaceae bacterium]
MTHRHDAILKAVYEAAFTFLRSTRWEEDIRVVLGHLGEAAGASRAFLFELTTDATGQMRARWRYEWSAPAITHSLSDLSLSTFGVAEFGLERWGIMSTGQAIHGPAHALPANERDFFERVGVRSAAFVPVFVEGDWWGVLGFTDDDDDREWEQAEIDALAAAAATLGGAIFRHRTEDRLQESEERFRQLSDAAAEGVVIHDRGVVLAANQSLARMFGYEMDEMIGQNFLDVLPNAESREDIIRHMRTDSYERYEVSGHRKDGTPIIVELTGRSMMFGGKRVRVGTINDVTKRKQGEEASRRLIEEQARRAAAESAEQRASFLAEASRVLGASFDYQTTLSILARRAVPNFADYCTVDMVDDDGGLDRVGVAHVDASKEELLRKLTGDWDILIEHETYVARLMAGESVLLGQITDAMLAPAEVDAETADIIAQLKPRSMIAVPLSVGGKVSGGLVLCWSVSDKHYTEDDLPLIEELARRASLAVDNARLFHEATQATRARDEMLSVVAHDLRNPLNTIFMGSSAMIEEILDADSTVGRTARIVKRAAERMNRLIQDLLDIRRTESGTLSIDAKNESVAALMREAMEMLKPLATTAGVELCAEVADGVSTVFADSARLLQVLSNLVGNAIKFTPRGGSITVRVEPLGDEVRFAVSDTGPGIPPDQLPHIFGRFWQANRKDRRGIGLGLAIAKGIVEVHGGRIWVESTLGEGSNFYFTIPAKSSN